MISEPATPVAVGLRICTPCARASRRRVVSALGLSSRHSGLGSLAVSRRSLALGLLGLLLFHWGTYTVYIFKEIFPVRRLSCNWLLAGPRLPASIMSTSSQLWTVELSTL